MADGEGSERSWGRRWLIAATLLAALILTAVLWYRSDGDLRALRADAKARGFALTWTEAKLTTASDEQWAALRGFAALVAKHEMAYMGSSAYEGEYPSPEWHAGAPLPEQLVTWHQQLPAEAVAEALTLIDTISTQGAVWGDLTNPSGPISEEANTIRDAAKYCDERIVVAAPDAVVAECERGCRLVAAYEPCTLIGALIRISAQAMVLDAIAQRMADLRARPAAELAPLISLMADAQARHFDDVGRTFRGELVYMATMITDSQVIDDWASWFLGGGGFTGVVVPPLFRLGRAPLIYEMMDGITMLEASGSFAATLDGRLEMYQDDFKDRAYLVAEVPNPRLWLAAQAAPAVTAAISPLARSAQYHAVVLAELQEQPWPRDVFRADGAPVQAVRHHGQVIAAQWFERGRLQHVEFYASPQALELAGETVDYPEVPDHGTVTAIVSGDEVEYKVGGVAASLSR
ncbi:MAG: hypothetical protein ACYTF0_07925 [Planctomycetota bacterium]